MKKLTILINLIFILYTVVFSQNNTFYRKYNLPGMNGGLTLQPTSDGGFVAAGQHEGSGSAGGCDIYVYRVDECGNKLWFKLIGEGGSDGAKSIHQISNDNFLISGHYNGQNGFNAKLDSDGNLIWLKTYSELEWVFQSVEANNGDLICVGKRANLSCVLFRTDSNGNVLWAKDFYDFGQMPLHVEETNSGEIVFLSTYNVPGKDVAVAKTDSSGNVIWSNGYGFGYSDTDHTSWSCSAVVNNELNTITFTSPTQSSGEENILVVNASLENGSINWSKSFGGPGSDQSRAIISTPHGYAICGNSDSYPVLSGIAPGISTNMTERNILLLHIDNTGNIIWSKQYGAEARDKGIGVGYNSEGGFTLSAYTSSVFFGNSGSSMDPLFIKTDSLGNVNCQSADCPITSSEIMANSSTIGNSVFFNLNASIKNPILGTYNPLDIYQCQDCYSVPIFGLSDSIVCASETVYLYNQTTIGLTCFQEWQIDGVTFNGSIDTIAYSFNNPGVYHVQLNSTCGISSNSYDLTIRVSKVEASVNIETDYNGYGVSCKNANDAEVSINVNGGYFPTNQDWQYIWTPNFVTGPNPNQLSSGNYSCTIIDEVGCYDTIQLNISEPSIIVDSSFVSSNYNGFAISCNGFNNGTIQTTPNFPTGGVPPYSYVITNNNGLTINSNSGLFTNLESGLYTIETTDMNGCTSFDELLVNEPPPLICNTIIYPDTCSFGLGAVLINAEGGVANPNADYSYQYIFNNVIVEDIPYIDSLNFGQFSYSVEDLNGCIESNIAEIPTITSPMLIGNLLDTISCNTPEILLDNWLDENYSPTFSYHWENQTGLEIDNGNDFPLVSSPGNYLLIASNENSICFDSLLIQIVPDSSIYFSISDLMVTNIVTQNQDDLNECIHIIHTSIPSIDISNYISIKYFQIFNRWGQLITEKENIFSICDEIQNLSSGTYYYIFNAESICGLYQCESRSGWFMIVTD